jgi:hypothetical protein
MMKFCNPESNRSDLDPGAKRVAMASLHLLDGEKPRFLGGVGGHWFCLENIQSGVLKIRSTKSEIRN